MAKPQWLKEAVYDGVNATFSDSRLVLFGAPFDATSSYRKGARLGPQALRKETLLAQETFSPYFDLDLTALPIHDLGDIVHKNDESASWLTVIEETTRHILNHDKIPFMLGGEHLVSLGAFRAIQQKYVDVKIVHLDAHTDFISELFGKKLSHGTVMRRIFDLVGSDRIHAFGIRSGSSEDFREYEENARVERFKLQNVGSHLPLLDQHPIYLTIDLDVFDPSQIPGTGTPETGGIWFDAFIGFLQQAITRLNIVGMDLVELAPNLDPTGMSTVFAGKVSREMMAAFFAADR
jgi:agmatinase